MLGLSRWRTLWGEYRRFAVKFALGSAGSYLLNIALTYALTEGAGWYYVWSFAATQLVLVIYSFVYNLKILFPSTYSHQKLLKFVLVLVSVSMINILSVRLMTEYLSVFYVYSVAFSVAFFVGLKYVLYKIWVFDSPIRTRQ